MSRRAARGGRQRAAGRDAVAELEQVYAELPELQCQGLCGVSCGPIAMSDLERRRVEERGVAITSLAMTCPALTALQRCSVYEVRPLICRLWGLVERMACPWGCRPVGGFVDDVTAHRLLQRVEVISRRSPTPPLLERS